MMPTGHRPSLQDSPQLQYESPLSVEDRHHGSLEPEELEDEIAARHEEEPRTRTGHGRSNTISKSFDLDEEAAVVKKLDRKLVLFLAFLYMLSFLDRSNIGNARIAGLEEALDMTDKQFDYCLIAFYVTYIAFEWMILLYRLVPAHVYISCCVFAWGLIASLQSMTTSFRQLLALRATLGITEAAFGPGVPYYMTFFYRRSELAYRVGLQIAAAPLATSFASSLAWVIVKLSENGPIESWRALFLFEGLPSLIAAAFAWYLIPDSPETVKYLTPRERRVAKLRLQDEGRATMTQSHIADKGLLSHRQASKAIRTLLSPVPWLQALIFLSLNVSFASLPVFLPSVIKSMEFSPVTSQILSAPPYLLSFFFVLLVGRLSDNIQDSRGWFLMACSGLSALSYMTVAAIGWLQAYVPFGVSVIIRYVAVYGAAMGLFSSVVLIIAWNLNNQPSKEEKGLAMVVMNVVGQCGPLIGVNLFPERDAPLYVSGMFISACFMLQVVLLAAILRWKLQTMNSQPSHGDYEMVQIRREDEGSSEAEGLMHDHPRVSTAAQARSFFRYML